MTGRPRRCRNAVQRAVEHCQPPLGREGPRRCPPRRHASGAGAADAPRRRRSRRRATAGGPDPFPRLEGRATAYSSQRQPSRWSSSRTGRPPVKMAARPVVTWSKRAGWSPSTSTRPRRTSFPPGPCSRRRRCRCGSAAPRCAGCRRRRRRGGGGPRRWAGAPRTLRRESSDAWKPAP